MSSIFPLQMKENYTSAILQQGGGVAATAAQTVEQLVSPRLMQSNTHQLACKENMVGQTHNTSSSHPMTRSRRHQLQQQHHQQQQQQQQAVCALQCTEMEVLSDCISTVDIGTTMPGFGGSAVVAPMDCTNTVNSAAFTSGAGFVGTVQGYATGTLNAPPPHVSKPKQHDETIGGYDYHQTGATLSTDSIQTLQLGGSLHLHAGKQHPQVPVLGFGMGTTTFTPLPTLQWAQSTDLWRQMRSKDVTRVAPETELRIQHPGILPSMRVILFDWMMEVS